MKKRKSISFKAKARRKRVVDAHIQRHGLWCQGHKRAPHKVEHSSDLTADHINPKATGGSEYGNLRVLCRSCNSSRSRMGSMGRLDKPLDKQPTHLSILP